MPYLRHSVVRVFCLSLVCLLATSCQAQQMTFEEYEPKSSLVVPQHPVTRAKYPFIDIHNHQNGEMSKEDLDKLVKEMDDINLRTMVNLSGGQGEKLQKGLQNMKGNYPQRFILFANIDFTTIDDPEFGRKAALQLEKDVKNGAQGLKIFKSLGLTVKYKNGSRMPVDDPRLDPIWQKCAQLNIPVLIHSGEPRQFFDPIDKNNERWLELKQFPTRARPPKQYPSWEQVMSEQHRLFARHSHTIFINAHLGWLGGNLEELGKLMDQLPNMYTEIGAVLAELGRQPKFARKWMIKYQDRVLFGKDAWNAAEYHVYFRVLETGDEYFDYYRKRHAFWKMYGLELPDEVLKKIYYKNALRIVPGIDASGFTSYNSN